MQSMQTVLKVFWIEAEVARFLTLSKGQKSGAGREAWIDPRCPATPSLQSGRALNDRHCTRSGRASPCGARTYGRGIRHAATRPAAHELLRHAGVLRRQA